MSHPPISELRTDPITGHKVYIAEDRAGRPTDYSGLSEKLEHSVSQRDAASCPFCEGHEGETPPAILEIPDEDGHWRVRVIPNRFPAVQKLDATEFQPSFKASDLIQPPLGAHEVIVESPHHVRDWLDLSPEDLATILDVYRQRIAAHLGGGELQQVLIFKNVGYAAGASLEHAHSQLFALPYISETFENELAGAQRHNHTTDSCVFCKLLAEELDIQERIIVEGERFVALCAFAGRQPYETCILPRSHSANFEQLPDEELLALAETMQNVLRRLSSVLKPLSYNLVLHTSPVGTEHAAAYHWHWELIPRTSQLAGLEWGAGVYVNPLSPERAAARLREADI